MRITEAAQRLGTSPRMLRYREALGLLPALGGVGAGEAGREGRPAGRRPGRPVGPAAESAAGHPAGRGAGGRARRGPGHRQFRDQDVAAVALALDLERRLDISPAALAFGLRVLAEPGVRAQVAELGRRIGRIPPPPGSALDFEKERALRLLSMGQRPGRPAPPPVPLGHPHPPPAPNHSPRQTPPSPRRLPPPLAPLPAH